MRPATAFLSAALAAAALLVGLSLAGPSASLRVEIVIHYSRFEPATITVPHGVPVTFVLVNLDPIDHEWLVGDDAFHERHRSGTEPHHGARPEEVSIAAQTTEETTITFVASGTFKYICHLPLHEEYGMVGTLTVT